MKILNLVALIVLIHFSSSIAKAFEIKIKTTNLSFKEIHQIEEIGLETSELLPQKIKKNITSLFIEFDSLEPLNAALTTPKNNTIYLNNFWLDILRNPHLQAATPETWGKVYIKQTLLELKGTPVWPQYPTMKAYLIGTLIHEIGHIYDALALPPMEYWISRKQCVLSAAINERVPSECRFMSSINRTVSDLPEFRTLAGFPLRGFLFPSHQNKNTLLDRTPDAFEKSSPEEAFAVNLSFFLTDPLYQCRRPLVHEYLSLHFDWNPYPNIKCQSTNSVLLSYANPRTNTERWEQWDYNKLYRIDYLWVGPGKDSASTFGHAMLRFVFCNSNRTQVGPECVKDLNAHRVVSFRAQINDFNVDSWKGITGYYSTYLYLLPMLEIMKEYNSGDLRDLFALPLKLTKKEQYRLYQLVVQYHWSYRSSYEFLTNNCAHETMSLINSVFFRRAKKHDAFVIKPNTLFDKILELQMGEGFTPEQLVAHPIEGLYYPSQRPLFTKMTQSLQEAQLINNDSLESYFEMTVKERTHIFENIKHNFKSDRYLLYAQLGLEKLLNEKLLQNLTGKELPQFLDNESKEQLKPLAFFKSQEIVASPWALLDLKKGYGIPQQEELEKLSQQKSELLGAQSIKHYNDLLNWTYQHISPASRLSIEKQAALIDAIQRELNPTTHRTQVTQ